MKVHIFEELLMDILVLLFDVLHLFCHFPEF